MIGHKLAGMALCCILVSTSALAQSSAQSSAQSPLESPAAPDRQQSATNIRAHMTFLAADALKGREAGTVEYDIAANYVAAQFALMGLKPGDDDGDYFQPVTLRTAERVDRAAILALTPTDGRERKLKLDQEFYVTGDALRTASEVTAPVVFAGYGVVAPEFGLDDYAGLDVSGKIVAVLVGVPPELDGDLRTHFRDGDVKRRLAAERGAVGYLTLFTPQHSQRFGFSRAARFAARPLLTWVSPTGQGRVAAPDLLGDAALSISASRKLFRDAPVDFDTVLNIARDSAARTPRFELPMSVRIAQGSAHTDVISPNVIGVLPGADPAAAAQTVVMTAHLDHIGVSESGVNGDTINNGAMDNAAGVSVMLETARMAAAGPPLERTTVFLAVTAEESGLIGSSYFVAHRPKGAQDIVANVNLDMPILLYDFTDIIAFGAERSSLGALVETAAARLGVLVSPDPMPEQNLFVRSDHYEFVKGGVPSVFLMTGFANGGEEQFRTFLATRYHRPNDDLSAPINFDAAAKFARLNHEILVEISRAQARPQWRAGDVFGQTYGGPIEGASAPSPTQ